MGDPDKNEQWQPIQIATDECDLEPGQPYTPHWRTWRSRNQMRAHLYKESANRVDLSRADPCARLSQSLHGRFQVKAGADLWFCCWRFCCLGVAEREGFEPSIQLETV